MLTSTKSVGALVAAGALLAVPATGSAAQQGEPHGHGKGQSKRCAKSAKVGFSVGGTLVSFTADDAATAVNEATVTLRVTSANKHARVSGELVRGATYTVAAGADAFEVKLGAAGTTPTVGDKVKVNGKVALTKKACAAAGTSLADRYATPDVRTVAISDRDAEQR
jgi:hypothetical protein